MTFSGALNQQVASICETLVSFLLLHFSHAWHSTLDKWLLDSFFNDVLILLSLSGLCDILVVGSVATELAR